jgi:bis(5'-nucleosyl)-tetraphosphatase (symmetrical)
MATYAIGDVQGCATTLERLLGRIGFSARDRLWLAGDLVNRGPRSLDVLRLIHGLGARAVVVLGNHDLHLLGRAAGVTEAKRRDTLDEVLAAPDRATLLDWLRARPILHREGPHVLVHAGLLPRWTVEEALERAAEIETLLRKGELSELLSKETRAARSLQVFTRLRTCRDDGRMCDFDGPPDEAPDGCFPWFSHPKRRSTGVTILFGHWSALGLHLGEDAIGLDTGCVWGRALSAVRLEDRAVFSEPAAEPSA